MHGSKALQLIAVLVLIIAAFLTGRSSVRIPEQPEEPSSRRAMPDRTGKLSAIVPPPDQAEASSSQASTERKIPRALTDEQDAAAAAATAKALAALSEELDDELDVGGIISSWLENDPDGAIAWLARGDRRDETMRVVFAIWGTENPEAAADWLDANKDRDWRSLAAVGLAMGLAANGDAERALKRIETIGDPFAIAQIWNSAGEELFEIAEAETLDQFARSGLPEELQRLTIEEWESNVGRKSKRNAQNIASVYASAMAAGADFKGSSAAEIAREIVGGVTGSDSFSNTVFQIPNLSEPALARALRNLGFDNGSLNYDPDADSEP